MPFHHREIILGGPIFDPLTVPNLVLDLDADKLAVANGAGIATWPDASGQGNTFSQATGANQPLSTSGHANGHAAAHFTGSPMVMTAADAASLRFLGDLSFFVVVNPTNLSNFIAIIGKGTDQSYEWRLSANGANGKSLLVRDGSGTVYTATAALTAGVYQVVSAISTGNSTTQYLNGAPNGTQTTALTLSDTGALVYLGSRADNATHLVGYVARLLAYNRAVTSGERAYLTAGLGARYGIRVQ